MQKIFEVMTFGIHDRYDDECFGIIDFIFDVNSNLQNGVFIKRLASPDCNWVLNPEKVRERFEETAQSMIGG